MLASFGKRPRDPDSFRNFMTAVALEYDRVFYQAGDLFSGSKASYW